MELTKKLGFGCMRLPMQGEEVDLEEFSRMVDAFMEAGFCYFDTAHGYLSGKSEPAIRECLVKRYPREAYILTDKLSPPHFETEEEILPLFEEELQKTGVSYFDYYLLHSITAAFYEKFTRCNAFAVLQKLKEAGKIRHIGISFHDTAVLLDRILTEHPEIEIVQLQFNYADYDSAGVQSRACYEVCVKHGKPVIVMEPVKGGTLVNLPEEAKEVFDRLSGGSYASYAIRFAASFPQVKMVLSGMSSLEQMQDNLSYMTEFEPLREEEYKAVEEVRTIIKNMGVIACTACRYCTDGCPKKIAIPDLFACCNSKKIYKDTNGDFYYKVHTANGGKASDCIGCGRCEAVCPQHLPVISYLKETAALFEAKE